MKSITTFIVLLGLGSSFGALAQGCCGPQAGDHAGCTMGGTAASGDHETHGRAQSAVASTHSPTPRNVFMEPVQSVYDRYLKVQGALAEDSLEGVAANAALVAKAIQADSMKMLPPTVAQQAEALAKSRSLAAAREAFKPLSQSLIQFAKDQKVPAGVYYEVYCPMAKASWLQTDKAIVNPYMGKSMVHCGQIKS